MMCQTEQPASVNGYYLLYTVTEQKAPVHDRHLRLRQWPEFAIQVGCSHE